MESEKDSAMQYISWRAMRVFLPICLLVSLITACEMGASSPHVLRTAPSAVASEARPAAPVKANISPREAKALLDAKDGYVYLDVRTVAEFTAGHVPGSWNIPVLVVTESGRRVSNADFLAIAQAALPKNAKIIVGCRSGSRSKRAQGMMKSAGYAHLSNMLGGFVGKNNWPGWSSLGYPIEAGDGGGNSYAVLRAKATP